MEGKEGLTRIGGTVAGSEAPTDYHVAQRTESQNPVNGSGSVPAAASPIILPPGLSVLPEKKKRGRPRKFRPDGSLAALSPKPISTVVPSPVIDFSSEKPVKLRPAGLVSKQQYKPEVDHSGESVACSVGGNFTPHMLTVNSGEDITMKIISFSQQGPRAVCILSATGVISSVTLRQPDSSGGTLTYEGRFEILSLSGSFMLSESGGTKSRSGGMSVSLASPDGRVIGGGVAGLLIAAGPIQIVVGSFLTGVQQEQKPKKHKTEFVPTVTVPFSSAEKEEPYGGSTQMNRSSTPNNLPSSSYRGELWSSRNGKTETNATTHQ